MDDGTTDIDRSPDAGATITPARRVATARHPDPDEATETFNSKPVSASTSPDSDAEPMDDDLGFQIPKRRRRKVASYDRVEKSDNEDENEEDGYADDTPRKRSKRPSWRSIVEVSAGVVLLKRTFAFNEPIQPSDPADYKTPGIVPALNFDVVAYPLAAISNGIIADIGIAGRYYRVLGLKSRVEGAASLADTVVQEFEVGARFRWNILSKASSPTLRLDTYFGQLSFKILDNQIALPNITYSYLKFGGGIDFPFYTTREFAIGATADAAYLLVLSAGDIERTDSGGYGESTTGGIEAGGGIFASYSGFFARATAFYRRFFYAFDGACYRQRRGCNYAGGALDVYMGGSLNVGYSY